MVNKELKITKIKNNPHQLLKNKSLLYHLKLNSRHIIIMEKLNYLQWNNLYF